MLQEKQIISQTDNAERDRVFCANTILDIYTHSLRDKESTAINALPDLDKIQEAQQKKLLGQITKQRMKTTCIMPPPVPPKTAGNCR